jgi:hypothetical protein
MKQNKNYKQLKLYNILIQFSINNEKQQQISKY